MHANKKLNPSDYSIAWLCSLEDSELLAARYMLDEEHENVALNSDDDNQYVFGSINGHNVVVACMPIGQPGKVSASIMVSSLFKSFPSLRMQLFVGIGGGIPSSTTDIRLGDVVVGCPENSRPHAVIQYDLYRAIQDEDIEPIGYLDKPDRKVLNALTKLVSNLRTRKVDFHRHLALANTPYLVRPNVEDQLFSSSYSHIKSSQRNTCDGCSELDLVPRMPRKPTEGPRFHLGTILSGDQVVRDAKLRDRLGARFNAICFEMEAAGVMDQTHCLVIRGISDYADTHKNNRWHGYAAAAAAAFAREFLFTMLPQIVSTITPVDQINGKTEEKFYFYPKHSKAHFVPRDKPLREIKALHDNKSTSGMERVAVLSGSGGCGKTQLALHYCELGEKTGRFSTIIWLDSTSPETVYQEFAAIARRLGMPESMSQKASLDGDLSSASNNSSAGVASDRQRTDLDDEKMALMFVKEKLSATAEPWLIVFDNHDNPQAFPRSLDTFIFEGSEGCVLITTRESSLSNSIGDVYQTIALSALSEDQAMSLLFNRMEHLDPKSDSRQALVLIRALGCFALAVAQARACIAHSRLQFSIYLEEYLALRSILSKEMPAESDYALSVYTTWELSLRRVGGSPIHQQAKVHFLLLSSFFDRNCITEDLFRNYIPSKADSNWQMLRTAEGKWQSGRFHAMARELHSLALIQDMKTEDESVSFAFHSLVYDRMRSRLQDKDRQNYTAEAFLCLEKYIVTSINRAGSFSSVTFEVRQKALSHVKQALENDRLHLPWGHRLGQTKATAFETNVCQAFCEVLHHFSVDFKASEIAQRALLTTQQELGDVNGLTLMWKARYSWALVEIHDLGKAESLQREVMAGFRRVHGLASTRTLAAMSNLARILLRSCRIEEAEALLNDALSASEKLLGPNHPHTLNCKEILADVFSSMGKIEQAEELLTYVAKQHAEAGGYSSFETLHARGRLAQTLIMQKQYSQAHQILSEVWSGYIATSGRYSEHALQTASDIARLYCEQRDFEKGTKMFYEIVEVGEKVLGKDHPNMVRWLCQLAEALDRQGSHQKAEDILKACLEIRREKFPSEYMGLAKNLEGVARSLMGQRNYVGAEVFAREALDLRNKWLLEDPMSIYCSKEILSLALAHQNTYQKDVEAEILQREVLHGLQAVSSSTDPHLSNARFNLQLTLRRLGREEEADKMSSQILDPLSPLQVDPLQSTLRKPRPGSLGTQSTAVRGREPLQNPVILRKEKDQAMRPMSHCSSADATDGSVITSTSDAEKERLSWVQPTNSIPKSMRPSNHELNTVITQGTTVAKLIPLKKETPLWNQPLNSTSTSLRSRGRGLDIDSVEMSIVTNSHDLKGLVPSWTPEMSDTSTSTLFTSYDSHMGLAEESSATNGRHPSHETISPAQVVNSNSTVIYEDGAFLTDSLEHERLREIRITKKSSASETAQKSASSTNLSSPGDPSRTVPSQIRVLEEVEESAIRSFEEGDYGEAESLQRFLLEEIENESPCDRYLLFQTRLSLRDTLRKLHKYSEAEILSRRLLEGRRNLSPDDHVALRCDLEHLAYDLTCQEKFAEAAQVLTDYSQTQSEQQSEIETRLLLNEVSHLANNAANETANETQAVIRPIRPKEQPDSSLANFNEPFPPELHHSSRPSDDRGSEYTPIRPRRSPLSEPSKLTAHGQTPVRQFRWEVTPVRRLHGER